MADFPETHVSLMPDYLAGLPGDGSLKRVADALDGVLLPHGLEPRETPGEHVDRDRRRVRDVLRDAQFLGARDVISGDSMSGGIYDLVARHEYAEAEDAIRRLGTAEEITAAQLGSALRAQPLHYTHVVHIPGSTEIDPVTHKPIHFPARDVIRDATLPGYDGPALDGPAQAALAGFSALVSRSPERTFRLGLLAPSASWAGGGSPRRSRSTPP